MGFNSTEISLLLQSAGLLLIILGYTAYLYKARRKSLKQKQEEKNSLISNFSGKLSVALAEKSEEKRLRHSIESERIINHKEEQMIYSIALPPDIEIIETETCLLIKGPVKSIDEICFELGSMEQLPEGYCVRLGNWKLFVLEDFPKSSREDEIIVMPADHWLFMSCKLRDSITGQDIHPYNYMYEPFTFKRVLEYGIGVEATDYDEFNKAEL